MAVRMAVNHTQAARVAQELLLVSTNMGTCSDLMIIHGVIDAVHPAVARLKGVLQMRKHL